MGLKIYKFIYGTHEGEIQFEIDTDKFTEEKANDTLTFFIWDYNKKANPINEVMKKYAIQALEFATFNNHNARGVKSDFENYEGFYPVDGSHGIRLIYVEGYNFDENYLNVTITNL